MGKIRQSYIKDVCDNIYNKHKDQVSTDFKKNVELVKQVTDVDSKRMRNRIAGYLITLKGKEGRVIFSPYKSKKMTKKRRRQLREMKKQRMRMRGKK